MKLFQPVHLFPSVHRLRPPCCCLEPPQHLLFNDACLPWGGAGLCTFEIKQEYFWDHFVSHFNPSPLREKETFPPSGSLVIPRPDGGSASPDGTSASLSLSDPASAEQCRPSGLPVGRRPVGAGANPAGRHDRVHTHCCSSYSFQVSTVTKVDALRFITSSCTRIYKWMVSSVTFL